MIAQAYGLKPEEVMKYTYPNMKADNFDAGNREVVYGFDPATGKFTDQSYDYGINPTDKYKADADTEQANIGANAKVKAAGISAGASLAPRFTYQTDANGNIIALSNRGGTPTKTGYKGTPKSAGNGAKPAKALTFADKKNLDGMVSSALQLATSPEDLQARLGAIAGNNPEAQNYVKAASQVAQYSYKNPAGFYETKVNPWAGKTSKKTFPSAQVAGWAKANGMTAQQAATALQKQGYTIQ
jgi:hypothetical protein